MSVCQDRSGEMLLEYVQGLLDQEETKRVADHLEGCPECASEVRVLMQFEEEVLPEPPPWFWTTLPGKVSAQVEVHRRGKMRLLVPVWVGGLAAAVIAALMLLQPGPVQQPQIIVPDYSVVETAGLFSLGLEVEILSVSELFIDDLDQTLGLELGAVSDDIMITMDLILEGDGYETMDEETIRVFENLLEERPRRGSERG